MASREHILNKLRKAQQPFTEIPPIPDRRHMVPMPETSQKDVVQRFITEAELLTCHVYQVNQKQARRGDVSCSRRSRIFKNRRIRKSSN